MIISTNGVRLKAFGLRIMIWVAVISVSPGTVALRHVDVLVCSPTSLLDSSMTVMRVHVIGKNKISNHKSLIFMYLHNELTYSPPQLVQPIRKEYMD